MQYSLAICMATSPQSMLDCWRFFLVSKLFDLSIPFVVGERRRTNSHRPIRKFTVKKCELIANMILQNVGQTTSTGNELAKSHTGLHAGPFGIEKTIDSMGPS
jgi:hypothetical protein